MNTQLSSEAPRSASTPWSVIDDNTDALFSLIILYNAGPIILNADRHEEGEEE